MCPRPAPYTVEDRQRLANELERLPPESILVRLAIDYFRLRAAAKACQEEAR